MGDDNTDAGTNQATSTAATAGESTATPSSPLGSGKILAQKAASGAPTAAGTRPDRNALVYDTGYAGPDPFTLQAYLYPEDRPFDSVEPSRGDYYALTKLAANEYGGAAVGYDRASRNVEWFLSKSGTNRPIDVAQALRDNTDLLYHVATTASGLIDQLLADPNTFAFEDGQSTNTVESVSFDPYHFRDHIADASDQTVMEIKNRFFPEMTVSTDWLYAFGAVYARTAVKLVVRKRETGDYDATFRVKLTLYDRYDWVNPNGKAVTVAGSVSYSDAEFSRLHATGLARNYDLEGTESVAMTKRIDADYRVIGDYAWFVNQFRSDLGLDLLD